MAINWVGIAALGAGGLLLYSAVTNKKFTDAARATLSGKSPATVTTDAATTIDTSLAGDDTSGTAGSSSSASSGQHAEGTAVGASWDNFLRAIRSQESGGNYQHNSSGCLGAYCWDNQSIWTEMALKAGQGAYAHENPANVPAAIQDAVASFTLQQAYNAAGGGTAGYTAAAETWNGGVPRSISNAGLPAQSWAPHCGQGTTAAYACQVITRMTEGIW